MPDHLGDDMRKTKPEEKEEEIKCEFLFMGFLSLFSILMKISIKFSVCSS